MADYAGFVKKILHDGESVRIIHRGYWLPRSPMFIIPIILLVISFFFMYALIAQGAWGVYVFFILVILSVILLTRAYLLWLYDIVIVTDQRIIDIDQKSLFQRVMSEALLKNIQDVVCEQSGIAQSLWKYGTIRITTAGGGRIFDMEYVYAPEEMQKKLVEIQQESFKNKELDEVPTADLLKTIRLLRQRFPREELEELLGLKE